MNNAEETNLRRARSDALTSLLNEVAEAPEMKSCYWIDGDDDGLEYCRNCAIREIRKRRKKGLRGLSLGGGYRTDHDHSISCHSCGVTLDGNLTEYGLSSEMAHFASHQDRSLGRCEAWWLAEILNEAACLADECDRAAFDKVCSWLEQLFENGLIDLPSSGRKCSADAAALRATRRACRTARVKRDTCHRLAVKATSSPT